MNTTTRQPLLRLLQLASPTLPVGGFAFSQGLEYATNAGWLSTREAVADWLRQQLAFGLARIELPILRRQYAAAMSGDIEQLRYYNAYTLACRETSELRLNDTAMGAALARLLNDLALPLPDIGKETSFVTAFAWAAAHWRIPLEDACLGLLWSWAENQVAAAAKLVPLGQTSAQQLLGELLPELERAVAESSKLEDADIGGALPGLAAASCRHESQYSRLFRS